MSGGADVRGRAARRDPSLVLMRGGSGYAGWRWWGSGVCRWEGVGAGWRGRWGGGRDGGLGEWVDEVWWGGMIGMRGLWGRWEGLEAVGVEERGVEGWVGGMGFKGRI